MKPMKTMKASEFKAKCLKVMDEVAETGQPVLITKNGKPVAQLDPVRPKRKDVFGSLKGQITIKGDIISPLYEDWEPDLP